MKMDNKYHIIVSIRGKQPVDIIANNEYSRDKVVEAFNDSHIPIISISSVTIETHPII